MAIAKAARKARRSKSQTENKRAQEAMVGKIEQLLLPSMEKASEQSSTQAE